MTSLTRRVTLVTLGTALAIALAGCVGPPMTGTPTPDTQTPDVSQPPGENPAPATDEPAGPAEQVASCEWDTARVSADAARPTGQAGDLATVLIGSWQHTHVDSGAGMESLEEDIRYVFPAPDQLIYCQHVAGITDHAENKTTVTLEGTLIAPPAPHPGFEVTAWSADRMVWTNNFDGSTYLLVRR